MKDGCWPSIPPKGSREGTRLVRSLYQGGARSFEKNRRCKGCVQPFASLCNLPSSSLSLLPSPASRNGDKRRIDVQLQRSTRVIPAIGLHLHINRCKAAVIGPIWREREREREGGAGFRIALMNDRCRTAATIYSMTATTTIDPETKRRVPLDCVTPRGTFARLSFATCHR